MFVYLITNKINGKQYVGQHSGKDLLKYWNHCIAAALRGSQDKPHLYNAVRKYESKNFEIESLVVVQSEQEMDKYEIGLIRALDTRRPNGYNLTDGGGGTLGHAVSKETREKISSALKIRALSTPSHNLGLKRSEETKRKLSESHLGKSPSEESQRKRLETCRSEEHRRKMSLAKMGNKNRLGAVLSPETKKKISESLRKRHQCKDTVHPVSPA